MWYEGFYESTATDLESPVVKTLAACHREMLERDVRYAAVTYGSDMRVFTIYRGSTTDRPVRPGRREPSACDSVTEAVNVLARMLSTWCKGAVA